MNTFTTGSIHTLPRKRSLVLAAIVIAMLLADGSTAYARTRLENICQIWGQREHRITGMGLVVGLNGSGDGSKSLSTIRMLQASFRSLGMVVDLAEVQDARNVAVVYVEATIPASGLRAGQKIDCSVNSIMGAKSLRGGYLIHTPLIPVDRQHDYVAATAAGPVRTEDTQNELSGRVTKGAICEHNQLPMHIRHGQEFVTLLLNESHATFHTADEVVRAINNEFRFEANESELARAESAGVIHVRIPRQYQNDPVRFAALLMELGVENPHTQARVIVNTKTGTIVVTGEVEIGPMLVAHENLSVQIGVGAGDPNANPSRFIPLYDRDSGATPQRLEDLIQSLNQLRVPTRDIINILRDLNRSGKLHAVYIEN